jgi:hypothetical protein
MKLVILLKICLNETCSISLVGKYLSDILPINIGLEKGNSLSSLLLNFAWDYGIMRIQKNWQALKLNVTY